jgi:hypothetical protein
MQYQIGFSAKGVLGALIHAVSNWVLCKGGSLSIHPSIHPIGFLNHPPTRVQVAYFNPNACALYAYFTTYFNPRMPTIKFIKPLGDWVLFGRPSGLVQQPAASDY